MKKFLRTGAYYEAEDKQLSDDIPFDEIGKFESSCNCKGEIIELKKQIADLAAKTPVKKEAKKTGENKK